MKKKFKKLITPLLPFLRYCILPVRDGHMLKKRVSVHQRENKYFFFSNGTPLFFGDTTHARIHEFGLGRCSHWENDLFFSSVGTKRLWFPFLPIIQKCTEDDFPSASIPYVPEKVLSDLGFSVEACLHEAIIKDNSQEYTEVDDPHILLFTHGLSSGGAERQWCYLANEIASRGFRTTLLVLSLEGEEFHYLSLLADSPVSIIALDTFIPSLSALTDCPILLDELVHSLTLAMWDLKPNFVLCQLDALNLWGSAAAILADCGVSKILMSFRNVNPSHFPYLYEPWMPDWYAILLQSKKVILSGNSSVGNDDYAHWLKVGKDQIHCIPNAFDANRLTLTQSREEMRRQLKIPENARVILGVFRLSEEKNPLLFLSVAKHLCKAYPDVHVVHAGTGHYAQVVHEEAERLGLMRRIHFLGVRSDVPDLMNMSDILLLCSNQEGLPNVVLEAQALKLPVVATKAGSVFEAVLPGVSALLADLGDEVTVTRHCKTLLDDDDLRSSMGKAGQDFVLENFTLRKLGDRTLQALGLPLAIRVSDMREP